MNKTALVTGASKGIGKAICQKLIQEGYHVFGIARSFDWEDPHLERIFLDLSDIRHLELNLSKIELGSLDVLVCNAGKGKFGFLENFSLLQIKELLDLNFLSQVGVIKAFLPRMKKQNKGDIILIGSESALSGKKQGSIYSATKFALRGFCQALREECAASNVRVSLINPGMVKTGFFEDLHFSPGLEKEEYLLPEDIAHTVSWVLSARETAVFDEINLTPQRKKIFFKKCQ